MMTWAWDLALFLACGHPSGEEAAESQAWSSS